MNPTPYTVKNKVLNVRAQPITTNNNNILRTMSRGEGFIVYEYITLKGATGMQRWGRISRNVGEKTQEFVCLEIGNTIYAQEAPSIPATDVPPAIPLQLWKWIIDVDAHLREHTLYVGERPG